MAKWKPYGLIVALLAGRGNNGKCQNVLSNLLRALFILLFNIFSTYPCAKESNSAYSGGSQPNGKMETLWTYDNFIGNLMDLWSPYWKPYDNLIVAKWKIYGLVATL
ncbi:hypothetical protein CDAR_248351 [Caerostris darwini]|uniref:Uncharacterized protein n=1 Tax=Caerostris darwini TaxID=1538125 RepID=A0AAV4UW51_9ARAC|nr:hypothetical protein CDAR_248351 [Caerostris darwini]